MLLFLVAPQHEALDRFRQVQHLYRLGRVNLAQALVDIKRQVGLEGAHGPALGVQAIGKAKWSKLQLEGPRRQAATEVAHQQMIGQRLRPGSSAIQPRRGCSRPPYRTPRLAAGSIDFPDGLGEHRAVMGFDEEQRT